MMAKVAKKYPRKNKKYDLQLEGHIFYVLVF